MEKFNCLVVFCFLILFFPFTAFSQPGVSDIGVRREGMVQVRIGVYENTPKIFTDSSGDPLGLFVDIIREIARRENWELIYFHGSWQECLSALSRGEIDLMPDVAHSLEREQSFDFHKVAVAESWSQIYSRPGVKLVNIGDLDGKRLAILEGSIQQTILQQLFHGFGYNVTFIPAKSFNEAFEMTSNGDADATVANHYFGDFFFGDFGLEKTAIVFNPVSLFFVTAKGQNSHLLLAIDRHLKQMRSEPESVYYKSLKYWMSVEPTVITSKKLFWLSAIIGSALIFAIGIIFLLRIQVKARTIHLTRANKSLQTNEEKYRNLFEISTQGVIYLKKDGTVVSMNPAAERILGISFKELAKTSQDGLWNVVNELGVRIVSDELPFSLALKTGKCVEDMVLGVNNLKTGELRWIMVNATPIFDKGTEVNHVFVVFSDITERKKLEFLLQHSQKMESVGRLAGGVAHDFNNLLTVILGYGEFLLEDLRDNQNHFEKINQIMQAGGKARELTKQLLAFSRKQVLELAPVDVNKVIVNFEKLLNRLIGENVELKLEICSEECLVFADAGQLEQVIMNLAINSRDAMPSGGTLIVKTSISTLDVSNCSLQPLMNAGEYVVIKLKDSGQGMNDEVLSHIFEPFFTTKGAEKGTGLGLATSYGIIRQHGGNIIAESESGKGAIFTIYLPLYKQE